MPVLEMGKSIRIDSACRIDSNRFTLPNRNEKFRFSTTATTLRASLTARSRHGSHLPASAKAISSSVAMRTSRSLMASVESCSGTGATATPAVSVYWTSQSHRGWGARTPRTGAFMLREDSISESTVCVCHSVALCISRHRPTDGRPGPLPRMSCVVSDWASRPAVYGGGGDRGGGAENAGLENRLESAKLRLKQPQTSLTIDVSELSQNCVGLSRGVVCGRGQGGNCLPQAKSNMQCKMTHTCRHILAKLLPCHCDVQTSVLLNCC